ncbi:MAG: hypothetical protein KBS60_00140 [Phascolarctobacterium sp.]|nr:hypothetical protein [Candidatus Phascolarctobacterium caballi]
MKNITTTGNFSTIEKPTYICTYDEFKRETSVEDGSKLLVVDEEEKCLCGSYIAYNGYWYSCGSTKTKD